MIRYDLFILSTIQCFPAHHVHIMCRYAYNQYALCQFGANLVPIWCQYALSAQPASTKSAPQNNPTGILCFFLFLILINLDPFSSTSTSTSTEYVCVWGRQLIAFFSSPFLNLRETSSYRLVQLCRTQYNPLQPCTRVKFK